MSLLDLFGGAKRQQRVESFMTRLMNHLAVPRTIEESRADRRYPATIGVRVVPAPVARPIDQSAPFDAVTRDVSAGGVSFCHARRFRIGETVAIIVDFDEVAYRLECVVRHSTDVGSGIHVTGCSIHAVDEAPREQFE